MSDGLCDGEWERDPQAQRLGGWTVVAVLEKTGICLVSA